MVFRRNLPHDDSGYKLVQKKSFDAQHKLFSFPHGTNEKKENTLNSVFTRKRKKCFSEDTQ